MHKNRLGYLNSSNRMIPKHLGNFNWTRSGFGDSVPAGGTIPANGTKAAFTSQVANLEASQASWLSSSTLSSTVINDQAQVILKDLSQYQQWTDSCSTAGNLASAYCLSIPFSGGPAKSSCYDKTIDGCVTFDTYANLTSRLQTLITNNPLAAPEVKPGIFVAAPQPAQALPSLPPPPSTIDQNFFSSFQPYLTSASYSLLAAGIPSYLSVLQNNTPPYTNTANILGNLMGLVSSSTNGTVNGSVAPLFQQMVASVINQIQPGTVDPTGGPSAGDAPPAVAADLTCTTGSNRVCNRLAVAKYGETLTALIPGIETLACLTACSDPTAIDGQGNSCCPVPYWPYSAILMGLAVIGLGVIAGKMIFKSAKLGLKSATFGVLKKKKKFNRKRRKK